MLQLMFRRNAHGDGVQRVSSHTHGVLICISRAELDSIQPPRDSLILQTTSLSIRHHRQTL